MTFRSYYDLGKNQQQFGEGQTRSGFEYYYRRENSFRDMPTEDTQKKKNTYQIDLK